MDAFLVSEIIGSEASTIRAQDNFFEHNIELEVIISNASRAIFPHFKTQLNGEDNEKHVKIICHVFRPDIAHFRNYKLQITSEESCSRQMVPATGQIRLIFSLSHI